MGGIELRISAFWIKALDLLDFDGDTVFAVSHDGRDGIALDFDTEPVERGGGYEIIVWGDRWQDFGPPGRPLP